MRPRDVAKVMGVRVSAYAAACDADKSVMPLIDRARALKERK